jgi:hypothetical protein
MRDLGRGRRMSTVPRSRSGKATHRCAVARCQKNADSGSHRRSRSLRLLCHRENSIQDQPLEPAARNFFFDSHWPARRVSLDGMEHQGVKIAMEGPINSPPVAGGAGRELPAYLSNGVVGLKVRDNPLQNRLHRGSSSKSKLWSAVDMTEPVGSQFLRPRMPTKRSFTAPAQHRSKWTKSLPPISHSCRCRKLIMLRCLSMAIYSRRLDTQFDGLAQTRGN